MEREAFVCPFCGAPQGYELQPGTIQARCRYCGSTILVPSELGGLYQQCPNHPGVASIGLCNRCGKAFCRQCLHVALWEDTKLYGSGMTSQYLCRHCLEKWKFDLTSDVLLSSPCSVGLTMFGFVLVLVGWIAGLFTPAMLGIFMIPVGLCLWDFGRRLRSGQIQLPPTLEEKQRSLRELGMIKRTECPHCKAQYSYDSDRIRPDHTVTCQNCGRLFKLKVS